MRRSTYGAGWAVVAWLAGSAVLSAGCGEASAPQATGRIETLLIDDPGGEIAFARPAPRLAFVHHKNFGGDYFHGTLGGGVQIQVSQDGARFHTVVGLEALSLRLQDPDEAALWSASDQVPAGVYRYVRLIVNAGQVTLDSGSEIGGLDLPHDVALSLGGRAVVTLDKLLVQPLHVTANSTTQLMVDFNTERWVTEDNILAGQVPTGDLVAALTAGSPAAIPALLMPRL